MNDMNPDSYLISTSILDFYEERGLIQRVPEEDLEKYTDYKPFFILHAYRLINQQSGHTQNILIIKPRYVIGEDDPLKLNKFSSLDTFILLWKITEFLSVSNLNIDYVVVDTNMSYEALIPWFLEDEEASNKYFSLFWTDYILDADNRDILYQILKAKTVEILKKKIIYHMRVMPGFMGMLGFMKTHRSMEMLGFMGMLKFMETPGLVIIQ